MSPATSSVLERWLDGQAEAEWAATLSRLLPAIHEVDRTATRIWFAFFPLALTRAARQEADPAAFANKFLLEGCWELSKQVDGSAAFLYGHRYWPTIKRSLLILAHQNGEPRSLEQLIRKLADAAGDSLKIETSLLLGISAVAVATLQQTGLATFAATPGSITLDEFCAHLTPAEVLEQRSRNRQKGWLSLLRGACPQWPVIFEKGGAFGEFCLIRGQDLTTAAASDVRDYHPEDSRCIPGQGPIPVECRSGSCGTCWVGVLGGADRLSPVGELEARRMRQFGYLYSDEPHPVIRLACQTHGYGAVTLVIPPWNGVIGKLTCGQQ